jgi:ubiquinone biosynthesis protein COQ4
MPRSSRIRLKDARLALDKLMQNPEETEQVFEIAEALAGKQPQRLLRRIRRAPGGKRLLRKRPIFDAATCDLNTLAEYPEGSFGKEFANWMLGNRFTPGLMERETGSDDPDLAYVGKRLMQVHDFWHVLTGYNRDPVGELGVLAFSFGQTGSRGIGFVVGMVLWRSILENWRTSRRPWSALVPYLWRGYRIGRRARFLPPVILEELLPLSLESVRTLLRIEPLAQSFTPESLPPIAAPAPA